MNRLATRSKFRREWGNEAGRRASLDKLKASLGSGDNYANLYKLTSKSKLLGMRRNQT